MMKQTITMFLALLLVQATDGFTVPNTKNSQQVTSVHRLYATMEAVPLSSVTSNLKPGRNYAPTKSGVKHVGSREEGYLGNLQRTNRNHGYSNNPYGNTYTPPTAVVVDSAPPTTRQLPSLYPLPPTESFSTTAILADGERRPSRPKVTQPPIVGAAILRADGERAPTQLQSRGPPIVGAAVIRADGERHPITTKPTLVPGAILAADGVGGRSASLLYNARSDAFNFLEAPMGKVPATTASVELRQAGYKPPPTSYSPTKSDIKYKQLSSSGSGYLDSLQRHLQPPQQRHVQYVRPGNAPDPLARSRVVANGVSGLLHVDPRTGESFSRDPFAVSRKAADAVSGILPKSTGGSAGVFHLI